MKEGRQEQGVYKNNTLSKRTMSKAQLREKTK